jgi:dihydrofolate reductase
VARALQAILALGTNDALGLRGKLPWSYPEDARYFDATTNGHAVLMGRGTWEERGTPLAGRANIVLSRTRGSFPGAQSAESLDEALEMAYALDETPFVIGGAKLFAAAMPRVTRVYLTRVPAPPEADTFFHFDPAPFRVTSSRLTDAGLEYQVLDRDA